MVRARPIRDTRQLTELIETVVPRTGKLHPATRVFQALRIATNEELEEIGALLEAVPAYLAPGARWVTIAFHSLEDRLVKVAFQRLARAGVLRILTKHVVWPSEQEIRENPPSRSGRLRAAERI
jgi:16S rRNA (cytosine1402-N4)-methyltransferase